MKSNAETQLNSIDFGEIEFGFAEAQEEYVERPDLLVDAFLDIDDIPNKVFQGPKWLVLGYKGSGKSAIGAKLAIEKTDDPLAFVELIDLQGFEYNRFAAIANIQEADEIRLAYSWAWVLLIQIARSFIRDHGSRRSDGGTIEQLEQALLFFGAHPRNNIQEFVRKSSEISAKLMLPKFFELAGVQNFERNDASISTLIAPLREIISSVETESQHTIIIDGLDSILTNEILQYKSISSLVIQTSTLNRYFRSRK